MKVTALKGRVQRVYVPVPGEGGGEPETVWVDFRPGMFTLEIADKIAESAEGNSDSLVTLLEPLLVDWDIEDEIVDQHGNPTGQTRRLGTNATDIKKVPVVFLSAVIDMVTGDMRPNLESDGSSVASSQPTGSLVPFPSGTPSVEPQNG
jgi:hypothetical protein